LACGEFVQNVFVKAILLDAGGVLLDESEMERKLCDIAVAVLRSVRPDYSEAEYWADVEESVVRFAPATRPYVVWKHCRGDHEKYARLYNELRTRQFAASIPLVPMPGIASELAALADQFTLVLAGQYGPELYTLLDGAGLSELFANRLSQADFSITKPDPRYLQQLAERAGVAPRECVMVGDRIDNDVVPARQNSMGSVLVRTGIYRAQTPRIPAEVPDIDLPSVNGLASAILARWS
jgi:putative hydrolase of the HAD superfamily